MDPKKMFLLMANGLPDKYDDICDLDPSTLVGKVTLTLKDEETSNSVVITGNINCGSQKVGYTHSDIQRRKLSETFSFDDRQQVLPLGGSGLDPNASNKTGDADNVQ